MSGKIVHTITSPGNTPTGLTWDGRTLWHCDVGSDLIYQLDPTTGAVMRSFASPAADPMDLAWDGSRLWVVCDGTDRVYQVDPDSGAVIQWQDTPGDDPSGLTFDGRTLWVADRVTGDISQMTGDCPLVGPVCFDLYGSALRATGGHLAEKTAWHAASQNKTYIAWQSIDYDPYIISYDHSTGEWSSKVKIADNPLGNDSHGPPSLLVDNDGYFHVFYGSHVSAQKYSKSTNPWDITDWTAQSDVDDSSTYPNAYQGGDGTIYLFYRTAGFTTWGYRTSPDSGASWSAEQNNVALSNRVYLRYSKDIVNDRIYVVFSVDDDADNLTENVYLAYFSISDGRMYNVQGTDLGTTIVDGELASCLVYDTSGDTTRYGKAEVYGSNVYVLFVHQDHLYLAKWDGGSWDINTTGVYTGENTNFSNAYDFEVTDDDNMDFYVGVGGRNQICTSPPCPTLKADGDMKVYSTIDGGNSWSCTTILTEAESGEALGNPQIVHNHTDELKIIFGEQQDQSGGSEHTADEKVYAWGDWQ